MNDSSLVKENLLKQSGAAGVIVKGQGVQVIYGPRVSVIKSEFEDYLGSPDSDNVSLATDSEKEDGLVLNAALKGRVAPLSETPDETFAEEMIGQGIVFFPTEGELRAPCDAKVNMVFPSKHAIGLGTEDGVEILIHVGIDTVKLEGVPFDVKIVEGQSVKKGELLMKFDIETISKNAVSTATPMVFTNLPDGKQITVKTLGEVGFETEILTIL